MPLMEVIAACAVVLWLAAGACVYRDITRRKRRMVENRALLLMVGVPLWPLALYFVHMIRNPNNGKR